MLAARDEHAAAAGRPRWRGHVPAPAIRETEEKQAGRVEGSLEIQFCRSEGEGKDRRRVIDERPELQVKLELMAAGSGRVYSGRFGQGGARRGAEEDGGGREEGARGGNRGGAALDGRNRPAKEFRPELEKEEGLGKKPPRNLDEANKSATTKVVLWQTAAAVPSTAKGFSMNDTAREKVSESGRVAGGSGRAEVEEH